MSSEPGPQDPIPQLSPPPRRQRSPFSAGLLPLLAFAAIFIIGIVLGGGAMGLAARLHPAILPPLTPAPIAQISAQSYDPVAIKGAVAEIFGNKFIVQDASGRALVETGPSGEGGGLVAKDETVTVQGRFERGFIHAWAIVHDGHIDNLGPPGPGPRPGHGPLSWFRASANFPQLGFDAQSDGRG